MVDEHSEERLAELLLADGSSKAIEGLQSSSFRPAGRIVAWALLPDDGLAAVYSQLCAAVLARCHLVCKGWASTQPDGARSQSLNEAVVSHEKSILLREQVISVMKRLWPNGFIWRTAKQTLLHAQAATRSDCLLGTNYHARRIWNESNEARP